MMIITERLDRYWAAELGCLPQALYQDGITVCTPRHRDAPRWMGWLVPFECVTVLGASPGCGVISVTPALEEALYTYLSSPLPPQDFLPPHGDALKRFARQHPTLGEAKVHRILVCEPDRFTPAPEVLPVEPLPPDDIHADWYRQYFDGPVFVARNEFGSIVSWAAIKCKADDVWEMAVATEPNYRRRGLARSVVSRATQATLDAGRLPIYLHEISNFSSARVSGALGYRQYGFELTCESGRIPPRRN